MIKKLRLMIIVPLISGLFACTGAEYAAVELGVRAVSLAVDTLTEPVPKKALLKDRTDVQVCAYATNFSGSRWDDGQKAKNWINEAKRRGFNVSSCNQITGRGFETINFNQTVFLKKSDVDLLCEASFGECETYPNVRDVYQRYLNAATNHDGLYESLAFDKSRVLNGPQWGVAYNQKKKSSANYEAIKNCEKYVSDCTIVMEENRVLDTDLKNKILELRQKKINTNSTQIALSLIHI